MKKIGITTTVPIEILIAAGYTPIDLNNIFITSDKYAHYIDVAERDGFPKSLCAWIKGLYGVCIEENITKIIGVVQGDCSNTKVLIEVLEMKGIKVYPFSYPHDRDKESVEKEIKKLMDIFKVNTDNVEQVRSELNAVRSMVKEIDLATYKDFKVSGFENHLYQVSCSDFGGNVDEYKEKMFSIIHELNDRKSNYKTIKLGYLGVPPMTGDLYEYTESLDAIIAYNEVQREFAFPRYDHSLNIFDQYYDYTYPYNTEFRLQEIITQIEERKLDGLIHYTQAFCHRAVEDIVLKKKLNIPILHIEGDKTNSLDARTKLRIEAFIDMLHDLKRCKS